MDTTSCPAAALHRATAVPLIEGMSLIYWHRHFYTHCTYTSTHISSYGGWFKEKHILSCFLVNYAQSSMCPLPEAVSGGRWILGKLICLWLLSQSPNPVICCTMEQWEHLTPCWGSPPRSSWWHRWFSEARNRLFWTKIWICKLNWRKPINKEEVNLKTSRSDCHFSSETLI